MAFEQLTNVFKAFFNEIFGTKKQYKSSQAKYAVGLLIISLAAVGGYLAYRTYVVYRERAAQKSLGELVNQFGGLSNGTTDDWAQLEFLFSLERDRNTRSYLAPYFIAFQSEALLKQGKFDEALGMLETMLERLPADNPVLPLFQTKKALMLLSVSEEEKNEQGLQLLLDLARNSSNQFNDMALYYLGRYYASSNKIEEAKKVWGELIDMFKDEKRAPSPWAEEAKEKIRQIA